MKNTTKAQAQAKNSANTTYKVFNVHNHITDSILSHRLPLNKETESLPKDIEWEQYKELREKYGTVPADQTKKAHEVMMRKLTKAQFAEKWNEVEGVLDLEEIKNATVAAKKLAPWWYDCTKLYKGGTIIYKFTYDGMYLFITAVVRYNNEVYKLEGKHNYGRVNLTKVSYNYDLLDHFYEKLIDFAESVCGEVSVGLTVITVGDSSVELELHENDEGRTVVAIIQDGNATERQVKNIVGELADFFGCKLNSVEVRKEADNE